MRALADPSARKLVLLVGPPGAGKSTYVQLARCLARNAERPSGRRVPEVNIRAAFHALETSPPSVREGLAGVARVLAPAGSSG